MHIKGLEIEEVGPFSHKVVLDFHPQVNILIGTNSVGKSTIIGGLHDVLLTDPPLSAMNGIEPHVSDDWPVFPGDEFDDSSPEWGATALVYVPATRIVIQEDQYPAPVEQVLTPGLSFRFGPFFGLDHVLDLSRVELAVSEAEDQMTRDNLWSQRQQLHQSIHVAYKCARQICNELFNDENPYPFVKSNSNEQSDVDRIVRTGMGIGITGSPWSQPLYVGDLSAGSQGTLLWIYMLALELASYYNWESGWDQQTAILLIDEIENHLHPTWQRRVIPALLEHFPGLQIFATTHSPFVVAGLKAGQVHLLNRDENGVVTATTNEQDVIGWTADEILRTFMGVDDPTDDATAQAAAELRRLRDEGPRADEQKEAARQESIRDLRKIVDRAELSGPREAENNRFLANLDSILERHRQSQNLNQENG